MDISDIDPWKHADFIYACYLIVAVGLAVLSAWIFTSESRQRRRLDELEHDVERGSE